MKIAVVVGHNSTRKGAGAVAPLDTVEVAYNNTIANRMVALSNPTLEIRKFRREFVRDNIKKEIRQAYEQVDAFGPDLSIELHFNGATSSSVSGTETLSSGSERSMAFAKTIQAAMVQTLGLRDRGVKVPLEGQPGWYSLHFGRAPAVLVEPFFGSNKEDCKRAKEIGFKGMAEMYLRGIMDHVQAEGFVEETPVVTDVRIVHRGLTRAAFFERNREALETLVGAINANLRVQSHGEVINELTATEVYAILNAEMAVKNGKVNAKHVHDNGTQGLLPLPLDLRRWNGSASPRPTAEMPVERNVKEFLLYLANLKNSDIGVDFDGGALYRDLFTQRGIFGDETKQMALLAAIVHGYFDVNNYSLRLPYREITKKVVAAGDGGANLLAFLGELGYRHAIEDPSVVERHIGELKEGIEFAGGSGSK